MTIWKYRLCHIKHECAHNRQRVTVSYCLKAFLSCSAAVHISQTITASEYSTLHTSHSIASIHPSQQLLFAITWQPTENNMPMCMPGYSRITDVIYIFSRINLSLYHNDDDDYAESCSCHTFKLPALLAPAGRTLPVKSWPLRSLF